ncbi:MAG: hypothetical protein JNK45_34620 [Myxococcales bacterium]|nr:hypothetical protein [Myxococcales bacterium]
MTVLASLRLLVELAMPMAPPPGRVRASEPPPVAPGASIELSVTILDTPVAGTPIELWLDSSDAVFVPNRFDNRDVADPLATQPRIRVRISAPTLAGRYGIDAHVVYVSCGETTCRPHHSLVHWDLEVAAPTGAAVAP